MIPQGGTVQSDHAQEEHGLQLPAPTAWPMVLALGITLVLAGMVTDVVVSILGGLLAVAWDDRVV